MGAAPKGWNLNSLALKRQVGGPELHVRPEGAVPFSNGSGVQEELGSAPSGRVGIGGTANLALKRQAIQISPFRATPRSFK